MTAYGAIISLKNTCHHIYFSCRLSFVPPSLQIIQVVYDELRPWKKVLKRLEKSSQSKSRKKVNDLDRRIKETIWNFEDLLESLLSHQIVGQSGEADGKIMRDVFLFSIDLHSLQNDADSFIQTLKDMKEEYIYEVDNMPEDEDEDESGCVISSLTSVAGYGGTKKSKMIGLSDNFQELKSNLLAYYGHGLVERATSKNTQGYGVIGMAGVGKTTLAKEIYEDPEIMNRYDYRLWITVGRKPSPRLNQDLRSILGELKGKEKCLIVLDDVWQTEELPSLLASILEIKKKYHRILLTARDRNVINYVDKTIRVVDSLVVRFLNDEESKDLLCHKVFGEEVCPYQLEKAATKIAKKCEGLPLTIVTVADFLSKSESRDDLEYWNDVAEERNSVFTDVYTEISKVFFPTYDYLPERLKMPLLFLGIFPRDYDIPPSKITLIAKDWIANPDKEDYSPEDHVEVCLSELCWSHNLVLFKPKSVWWFKKLTHQIKTCRLHSSWRQLCRGEAKKSKFYYVLNKIGDALQVESIKGQRCLCLENNLLFGIKEFSNSVRSNCTSSTRSLLFYGPYHKYPTPLDDAIGFTLLRELDALQLRFYTFPTEILTLVQLKYLALTCNGDLPSTISKLFNLQVLIIRPHMSIIKCCDTTPSSSSSSIPIEIWDMVELEHVEIMGKRLIAPPNDDDGGGGGGDGDGNDDDDDDAKSLVKLSTLVGVNAASICTISKRIPNIQKLGVQMEMAPCGDNMDHSSDVIVSCFAHISKLKRLRKLKCSITNPSLHVMPSPCSSLVLPSGLRKLHLSGMGFPWEYMDVIGCLPHLRVLKLRSYAFRGARWESQPESFWSLQCLLIEDSDLVEWIPGDGSFRELNYLSFKHCYKLQELHWSSNCGYAKIELVNCNPIAVSCAKKLERKGCDPPYLFVSASDDFEA